MISRILFALGAAIALLPGMARAEGGEFNRPGFYAGVGGIFVQNGLTEDRMSDLLPADVEVDNSAGVSAQLGYRAFSFLATELEYDYVTPFDLAVGGMTVGSVESHRLTANVKAILPIWRVQPYLMGGIGFANTSFNNTAGGADENDTDLAGRVGGGVDFHLTPRVSLDVGADVVFIQDSSDIDFVADVTVGAGLRYRFWAFSGE